MTIGLAKLSFSPQQLSLANTLNTSIMLRHAPKLLRPLASTSGSWCGVILPRTAAPATPPSSRLYSSEASDFSHGPSFSLTEEQQSFQELARDFTLNEVIPVAAEHDRTMAYPWDVIKKAHAAGLVNLHIPEAYGGPGLGVMSCSLISEELAYGCTGIQTAIEANGLAQAPVILGASEELKQVRD